MEVILSIKPRFADRIFEGTKKYEYRKQVFRRDDVTKVIVYASAPVKKVIGEFEIDSIICEEVASLWDRTKDFSGITSDYFFTYFANKEIGYAIVVKNQRRYENPLCLEETYGIKPPQSFVYADCQ